MIKICLLNLSGGKLLTKNAAIKVATHYANVACPFFTYQPKMSAEVKKLRKF